MQDKRRIVTAVVAALVAASTAAALEPAQVLVVANRNDEESVELARFYLEKRGIPQKNLALLDTTGEYDVSRSEYDEQIRDPLRRYMTAERLVRTIRCLCLIRGVPVRIKGGGTVSGVEKVYGAAAERAHIRLAVDYKLLGTVGRTFPEPRTDGLQPLGALFASPMPEPPTPLQKFDELRKDVNRLLAQRRLQVDKLDDRAERAIAARQVMALHLDIYGLPGLISYLEDADVPGEPDVDALRDRLAEARKRMDRLNRAEQTTDVARRKVELLELIGGVSQVYTYGHVHGEAEGDAETSAAVDSELACLWWTEYDLDGRADNPLHWRNLAKARKAGDSMPPTLLTSRLDGPSRADVTRLIKSALAAEQKGLDGVFYIDAGGPARARQYDQHLVRLRRFLADRTELKVVFDAEQSVFQPGDCPQAALYVGWYSLRRYVDAFMWTPGAVGWHIASFEAMHLRDPSSKEWVPQMIQNGVTATIGAVEEPYLGAFPLPEEFFPILLTGQATVAETYWQTTPWLSWRLILIGDPLYNPFAARPLVDVSKAADAAR